MPQGNLKPGPRHTEVVARETCTDLALEALRLMRGQDPQQFELAAQKFDEAADACRIAEKALRERMEAPSLAAIDRNSREIDRAQRDRTIEFLTQLTAPLLPDRHVIVIGDLPGLPRGGAR